MQEAGSIDKKESSSSDPSSFGSQFNALFRKNIVLQKRAKKTNLCQCLFPIFLLGLLVLLGWLSKTLTKKNIDEDANPTRFNVQGKYIGNFDEDKIPYQSSTATSVGVYDGKGSGSNTGLLSYISNDGVVDRSKKPLPSIPAFRLFSSKAAVDDYLYDYENAETSIMMGFLFNEYDGDKTLKYTLYYNATTGLKEDQSFGEYTPGQEVPGTQFIMDRALFKSVAGNSNGGFQTYMRELPKKSDSTYFDFIPFVEPLYYTWILHFLFPVFVEAIVFEKQYKLRDIMKMMGLKMRMYWLVQYLFDWVLYLVIVTVLISFGFILQFRFFTINLFWLYFFLFLIWGFTLIAFALFCGTIFGSTRGATILGYFYVILVGIAADVTNNLLAANESSDSSFLMVGVIPTFALNLALRELSQAASNRNPGLDFSNANIDGNHVFSVYILLAVEAVVLYLLAFYLENVFPSGYGVKKHPLFLCQPRTWSKKIRDKEEQRRLDDIEMEPISRSGSRRSGSFRRTSFRRGSFRRSSVHEPFDVAAERQHVAQSIEKNEPGVFIKNLRKVFKAKEMEIVAVDNLSIGIGSGECLGFLGHNGAGKTTTINILSGLYGPTKGSIRINSLNPLVEMDRIHSFSGVCPQHDILWGEQSGREHLLFYGRLKGLDGEELKTAVKESLESVNLTDFQNTLVKGYSGGMKRRLSVAISLIGGPRVVFLDEPTTGLDPHSKREVWEAILRLKKGRAIILTTHSMEEADALCDRIAVMSHGKLQCIGHSEELKKRYGSGYKLSVSTDHPDKLPGIHAFVASQFPESELLDSIAGTSHFVVPTDNVKHMSALFRTFEAEQERIGITDWGIGTTTLEEVFVRLTTIAGETLDEFDDSKSGEIDSPSN